MKSILIFFSSLLALCSCARLDNAINPLSRIKEGANGSTTISYTRENGKEEVVIDFSSGINVIIERNGYITQLGYRPLPSEEIIRIRKYIVDRYFSGGSGNGNNVKMKRVTGLFEIDVSGGVNFPGSGYEFDLKYKTLAIDSNLLEAIKKHLSYPEFSTVIIDFL